MHRICGTLAQNGFNVLLIGRKLKTSQPLAQKIFTEKRIACFFNNGFGFYAEYNFRLFWFLIFTKANIFCAIDLDTILPVLFASAIKRKKRVYDAHELFTEQKEIVTRKSVHTFWLAIEKFAVPKFYFGYTVNDFIANEFNKRYKVDYVVIRNLPLLTVLPEQKSETKFIIYQGAVNEGRSFETLLPAMKNVNAKLVICGSGNFFDKAKRIVKDNKLEDKIEFRGMLSPAALQELTPKAYIGIMIFENKGLNQYQSLSNRFFDYIMACVPQLCVNYPEYKKINDKYRIAYIIDDVKEQTIANALNELLTDEKLYNRLRENCIAARKKLNWQNEEQKLLSFYNNTFGR